VAIYFCAGCGVRVFAQRPATIAHVHCYRCASDESDGTGPTGGATIERFPDLTVVRFEGEVELATAGAFHLAMEEALARGKPIEIDLADCSFMDSSGLHVLLDVFIPGRHDGSMISNPSPGLRRLLNLAGLDDCVRPKAYASASLSSTS
jgi:anti-anti-sigma factor